MQISKDTIFLIIGIFMVFIGVFGGGFQIKEIKIPQVNKISRIFGFAVGAVFILVSLNVFGPVLDGFAENKNISQNDTTSAGASASEGMSPLPKPDMDDTLKEQLAQLEDAWPDLKFSNNELLVEYQRVSDHEAFSEMDFQTRSQVKRRIAALRHSIERMKDLRTHVQSDSTVVTRKYELLKNTEFERLSNRDSDYISNQKKYYQKVIEESAYIKAWEDFGTYRSVNKSTLNPVDRRDRFNSGTVWVWARIHAPKDETLKLEWIESKSNKVLKRVNVKVRRNVATGFRIYYSKTFSGAGDYEVRLFNRENQLIGRQRFIVS